MEKHIGLERHIRLLCFGIVPMVVGFLFDKIITSFSIYGFSSILLSIIFFTAWGFATYKLIYPDNNLFLQIFEINAFGIIMLALVLFQALVLGSYWLNIFGFATQMFFLPGISIASLIASPFMKEIHEWQMYIISWLLIVIVSCIGVIVKKRKNK